MAGLVRATDPDLGLRVGPLANLEVRSTPLGGLDRFAIEVQVCISAAGFEFATVNHAKDGPLADSEKLGGGVCGNPANLIG
jgi:hypothetical protein